VLDTKGEQCLPEWHCAWFSVDTRSLTGFDVYIYSRLHLSTPSIFHPHRLPPLQSQTKASLACFHVTRIANSTFANQSSTTIDMIVPVSSNLAMTKNNIPMCCNPACPSTIAHSTNYYNFSLSYKDETTRSNRLPHDIRVALDTIYHNQSMWQLDEDKEAYLLLAKFAVAHQSPLEGLMPREVTMTRIWCGVEVQEVLRGAGPRPVQASLEPVKIEEKKVVLPLCRLKNGMGRGVFSGKPGVTFHRPS